MKQINRGMIAIIIGLLMISCINDFTNQVVEGSNYTILSNSRTIIKGNIFGGNSTPIMKTVPLFVQNIIDGLYLEKSYTVVKNSYNDGFFIVVEIENKGSESYCFVQLENIFYYDKNGNKLNAEADFTYSSGNTGQITTGFTDTCLFPNDKAIFLLLEDFYNELSYVTCELYVSDYSKPIKIESLVQGEYYKYEKNKLDIKFRNSGRNKLDIDSYNFYLLRNSDNIPVDWGYFTTIDPSSGIIDINSMGTISTNVYSLSYPVNQVEICFDYAPFLDSYSNKENIDLLRSVKSISSIELNKQRNLRIREMEI